jgi:hypothetical protein
VLPHPGGDLLPLRSWSHLLRRRLRPSRQVVQPLAHGEGCKNLTPQTAASGGRITYRNAAKRILGTAGSKIQFAHPTLASIVNMASAGIKRLTMWIIAVSVFGAAPAVRSNCGRAGGHGERQTDRGYK